MDTSGPILVRHVLLLQRQLHFSISFLTSDDTGGMWPTGVHILHSQSTISKMTTTIWHSQIAGQRAPTFQRLLLDSGKLSRSLNKLHSYGTTIYMPFYSLFGPHSPELIQPSLSTDTPFGYFSILIVSACYSQGPQQKLWSRFGRNSSKNISLWTSACHAISSPSRSPSMKLVTESVSVRKPISQWSSGNAEWRLHTWSQFPRIRLWNLTLPWNRGRRHWTISQTIEQSCDH